MKFPITAPATIATIPNLPTALARDNWSVISGNPAGSPGSTSGIFNQSSYALVTVPLGLTIDEIVLGYTNCGQQGYGWSPGINPVHVKASMFLAPNGPVNRSAGPSPDGYFEFNGSERGIIGRGKTIFSKGYKRTFIGGQQFYIMTAMDCVLPAAPSAPSCTGNTGSGSPFVAGQVYTVAITYVFGNDLESYTSAGTAVTISTNGNNIVITGPSDPLNGARGWRFWMGAQNTASPLFDTSRGVIPFGTVVTMNQSINITNLSGGETVIPGNAGVMPTGFIACGGTAAGGCNSGESTNSGLDLTNGQYSSGVSTGGGGGVGPTIILARSSNGVNRSVSLGGDSINQATFDSGFANGSGFGGFMIRAALGQTANVKFSPTIVPPFGNIRNGVGGESMSQFAGNVGAIRGQLDNICTSIWKNYGTNDLSTGPAVLIQNAQIVSNRGISANRNYYFTELFPRGGTTDGYATLANQTLGVGAQSEACRRAYNNWGADTTGAVSNTETSLFQGFAGSVGPTYNIYGGGNSAATQFWFQYPCAEGTETITNGGSACTHAASPSGQLQYSYLLPATINGVTYASGIQFGSAPTNGNLIAATYTKIPGLTSLLGSLAHWVTGPSAMEINGSGVPGVNGGFIKLSEAPLVSARGCTATSATTLTDTTLTGVTQDQYSGYCLYIVTDSVTPTAVGQNAPISNNTASGGGGVIFTISSWSGSVTPSTSATYQVYKSYMVGNGPHPSSFGHMLAGAAVNIAQFV